MNHLEITRSVKEAIKKFIAENVPNNPAVHINFRGTFPFYVAHIEIRADGKSMFKKQYPLDLSKLLDLPAFTAGISGDIKQALKLDTDKVAEVDATPKKAPKKAG
jgi:hypothetical protein